MTLPAEVHEYILPLFKTQVCTIPMLVAALHGNTVPNQTTYNKELRTLCPDDIRLW